MGAGNNKGARSGQEGRKFRKEISPQSLFFAQSWWLEWKDFDDKRGAPGSIVR